MNKKYNAIYIAFGANLSNPKQTFQAALVALEIRSVRVVAVSGLWQSPAWPFGSGQPDYTNGCMEVRYDGPPQALLKLLHEIESKFGRVRSKKNAARTLDLDLLDFGGIELDEPEIKVPHPRMLLRGFVLLPLSQIAPNWVDPVSKMLIDDHIARLPSENVLAMEYLGNAI